MDVGMLKSQGPPASMKSCFISSRDFNGRFVTVQKETTSQCWMFCWRGIKRQYDIHVLFCKCHLLDGRRYRCVGYPKCFHVEYSFSFCCLNWNGT